MFPNQFPVVQWQRGIVVGALLAGALAAQLALADEPAADSALPKVSYYTQIRPIFQAHCQGCHQPAKQGGDYVMTSFDSLFQGGESATAAIVPGKPAESNLIDQITPANGAAEMPKGKAPLTPGEIELITNWITAGAVDDTPASAKVHYDNEHPPTYAVSPVITSLDYSPDGQILAVSGYHEVLLHKADGSELLGRLVGLSERIETARFSPDGKLLAVTGGQPGRMGEVQVWDIATKTLKLSVPVTYDTIYGASWSPDSKLIAFGCGDNTSRAIEAETGKQVFFSGAHSDWCLDTVFSVDGSHLVTVGRDMTMKLVIVEAQRFVDNITSITPGALKGGILSVDRHPTKDELAVGGADGVPKTYLMHRTQKRVIGDDYQKIRAYEEMPGRVFAVAYNHDGSRIVAGSSYNGQGQVRVYETETGKLVWKLDSAPMYAVRFSPDGQTVAAGGFDGKVLLLKAETGEMVKDFVPVPITVRNGVAGATGE